MRVCRSGVLLSTLLFCLTSAPSAAQEPSNSALPSAETLMQRWVSAWTKHDSVALKSMLDDNVWLGFGDGAPWVGRDSVMQFVRSWQARSRTLTVSTLYTGKAVNNSVYHFGRWRIAFIRGGAPMVGVHNFVFRRQPNGAWRI